MNTYIVLSLLTIIVSLYFIYYVIQGSYVSKGSDLYQLQKQSNRIELENNRLEEDILTRASLNFLSIEATKSGFIETNTTLFIK